MDKRGFTLIELLAVIVILAIIALIATPIVLSIIDDTKKSSMLRSAEMYLDAVELAVGNSTLKNKNIEDKTYNIMSDGNICLETLTAGKCIGTGNRENNEEDILKVEVDGEVPQDGSTIKFENGKIIEVRLVYKSATIVMDEKNNLVFADDAGDTGGTTENTLATICTHDTTNGVAEKTAGAKYSCEVKEGTSYNFYVLKTPAEGDATINLIMDQNINSDGTPAGMTGTTKNGDNVYNLVAWNDESGQSTDAYGPVTAMQFLYNATKDWTNIDPVNYTYNDRTVQGNADGEGYTSFVSSNGVATITPVTGDGVTIGSEAAPLRARMPIYASDTTITEVTSKTNASYLYDNLDPDRMNVPYGYWTLSSRAGFSSHAWFVDSCGDVFSSRVWFGSNYGVRPVINLKI